ncbi:hypothetical protein [Empedobacter brevis]|uniref:hypothetical protein n=1 Tax=Empedobacter brevis TaxID=247 RepID=UPI0028981D29|nr:hypothetical protein [Empedobacter brevis]
MNNLMIKRVMMLPIGAGLIFTMMMNGWELLTATEEIHLAYLNNYNRTMVKDFPAYFTILLYLTAILQLVAAVFLIISLSKREFLENRNASFFKWGLFFSILSVTLYGLMVRLLSNHTAAANLYFYVGLLYFCLWYVEHRESKVNSEVFIKIKILPIYFMLFYTMGFPGWQKIMNSVEVMGRYTDLFHDSFLSNLPGGIEPFIYLLGVLELSVAIMLILSLIKREFLLSKSTQFLDLSLLVSVATFIMLSFGLGFIFNYPGATNLVFYAIFTLGLYAYISETRKQITPLCDDINS